MARRRAGFVVLPALLVGGALLSVLPEGAGAIRIAGVSLTWWYAIVLAPAVATSIGFVAAAAARRWSSDGCRRARGLGELPGCRRCRPWTGWGTLAGPRADRARRAGAGVAARYALASAGDDRVGRPPRHRARRGG